VVDPATRPLNEALAQVAPGTPLREGLDRVLKAKRGALVVIGDSPAVLSICSGGFLLDAEFTPQRLSELAKMDGAIILAADASRIARANVHLVPKSSIPTNETGTRHRTAQRVARSLDVPVISVSESMSTIAIYRNEGKHTFQPTGWLIDRASQALSTLGRFKTRFDLALGALSTLEVADSVSVRDVVAVLQPGEMMLRIQEEIEEYLIELGDDGRLIRLQLEELASDSAKTLRLVVRDYVHSAPYKKHDGAKVMGDGKRKDGSDTRDPLNAVLDALHQLSPDELLDAPRVAGVLGLGGATDALDAGLESRGYRLLTRLPRISEVLIDRIVDRFSSLSGIMGASLGELEKIGGVGSAKARSVKEGLARTVEASILERYD
jgi:diadenylate cyclase